MKIIQCKSILFIMVAWALASSLELNAGCDPVHKVDFFSKPLGLGTGNRKTTTEDIPARLQGVDCSGAFWCSTMNNSANDDRKKELREWANGRCKELQKNTYNYQDTDGSYVVYAYTGEWEAHNGRDGLLRCTVSQND